MPEKILPHRCCVCRLGSHWRPLYVTGFDQGVEVYDPNGLPFLNTLTEMRNGFGYWVKSAVATDGDVLALGKRRPACRTSFASLRRGERRQ